ncbi:MAG: TerB family tellurite resistance protein [Flavobacteriales bacterium]|nr:TerB family tellurite resistance protein [Flavobacteriales bacterium]
MGKYAKWLGGTLGWAFGGPIGALLGFALGTIYDNASGDLITWQGEQPEHTAKSRPQTTRADFEASLLVLTAAVMKADGSVKRSELDFVKRFFVLQFGETRAGELLLSLREMLQQEIAVDAVAAQIGRFMDASSRLQLLHYLFQLANADGAVHGREVELITRIAAHMRISTADLNSIKAMFVSATKESAYAILEVDRNATDDEVKKAYRKMAVKYHPDKVTHLGDEHQHMAKEKFQKLTEAYDQVKKERGMN